MSLISNEDRIRIQSELEQRFRRGERPTDFSPYETVKKVQLSILQRLAHASKDKKYLEFLRRIDAQMYPYPKLIQEALTIIDEAGAKSESLINVAVVHGPFEASKVLSQSGGSSDEFETEDDPVIVRRVTVSGTPISKEYIVEWVQRKLREGVSRDTIVIDVVQMLLALEKVSNNPEAFISKDPALPEPSKPNLPSGFRQLDWPSRDLPFKDFMRQLYFVFKEAGLQPSSLETQDRYCPGETPDGLPSQQVNDTLQQRLIPIMLRPDSPYHGMIAYHMVGSGKTRTGLATLGQWKNVPGAKLIWVTTPSALGSTMTKEDDLFAFGETAGRAPFFKGSGARRHSSGRIAIFTYQMFVNALKTMWGLPGRSNQYGRMLKAQSEGGKDPFNGAIIVIDEAHKIFEDKNGAGDGQFLIERLAMESYQKSGADACRWLLLTATPMPTLDIPSVSRKGSPQAKTAGGREAAFRLLNLLIPEPSQRLPVELEGYGKLSDANRKRVMEYNPQHTAADFDDMGLNDYLDRSKGLVSYFLPDWRRIFARVEDGNVIAVNVSEEDEDFIEKKLRTTCRTHAKKEGVTPLARCYMRRRHWFGSRLQPKKGSSNEFPGSLNPKTLIDPQGQWMTNLVPRATTLVERVRSIEAEEADGRHYKHVVYSSDKYNTGAMYATALIKMGGYTYLPANKLGDHPALKVNKDGEVTVDRSKIDGKKYLFYMPDKMRVKDFRALKNAFNHPENVYGDIARIIVLGAGRKEALSLKNIRYLHVMEPQITKTDMTQIIGRARRYCSHVGMDPEERKITVYVYGLQLTSDRLELHPEYHQPGLRVNLSDMAIGALKSTDKIQAEFAARDKILGWMEAGAIDIAFSTIENDEISAELARKMQEAQRTVAQGRQEKIIKGSYKQRVSPPKADTARGESPVQAQAKQTTVCDGVNAIPDLDDRKRFCDDFGDNCQFDDVSQRCVVKEVPEKSRVPVKRGKGGREKFCLAINDIENVEDRKTRCKEAKPRCQWKAKDQKCGKGYLKKPQLLKLIDEQSIQGRPENWEEMSRNELWNWHFH